jgi:tetratricopeptide (TPR) repeat protein
MHKPGFIYSIINSAIDCISSGNISRAKSLLRAAAKNLPNNSEINRLMGVAEAISGNQVMALDFFNKAIKFDSKNSNAYSNRGNIYSDMGNTGAAIDDYFAAIKLEPNNCEAFYMRGLTYEKLEQIELAIQDYSKAISINPGYVDAYLNAVALLIAKQRFHDALNYLKILAKRHPDIHDVWLSMGYVFIELKEFDLAMECHEKALALNPKVKLQQ